MAVLDIYMSSVEFFKLCDFPSEPVNTSKIQSDCLQQKFITSIKYVNSECEA